MIPLSRSTGETVRTNRWALPTLLTMVIIGLLAVTCGVDARAAAGQTTLPPWVSAGGPDVARQILIAIAAAVATLASVVFSIAILGATGLSAVGPRMIRNFIRDIGTQASLGFFVATCAAVGT